MHWRFRKLNYDVLIPKLGKNIFQLNEEEAAAYFESYLGKNDRITGENRPNTSRL